MDNKTYSDPLAAIFPPADKHRFAGLDWPQWDADIFLPELQDDDFGNEVALVAGTTYVRNAVSLKRPQGLSGLLDTAVLNFLARWALRGFPIEQDRAYDMINEGDTLLVSFRAGVLIAIDELRAKEIPEGVNKDHVTGVVDALEAYCHEHYITMGEVGPPIAQHIRQQQNAIRDYVEQGGLAEGSDSDGELFIRDEQDTERDGGQNDSTMDEAPCENTEIIVDADEDRN